eukprot:EG_transcript_20167
MAGLLPTLILLVTCLPSSRPAPQHLDTAVLLEPRRHPLLIPILDRMLYHLPPPTVFQVFHGNTSGELLNTTYWSLIQRGRMVLVPLNVSNGGPSMLNYDMKRAPFWERILGEWLLFFQLDSAICSGSPWSITDFISDKWDFVGAPHSPITVTNHFNGGFSLRRRSKMLAAVRTVPFNASRSPNEDMYFSVGAVKRGVIKRAPRNVAMKFSVETTFYDRPFGFHKPWAYLKPAHLAALRRACPELLLFEADIAKTPRRRKDTSWAPPPAKAGPASNG